jgi:hypothetical protein
MKDKAILWGTVLFFLMFGLTACGGGGGGGGGDEPVLTREYSISGRVIDSSAVPVAQATVAIDGAPVSALTDAQGNFTFRVSTGIYDLTVTKDGITFYQAPLTVDSSPSQDIGDISPTVQYFQTPQTWHRDYDGDGYSDGTTLVGKIETEHYSLLEDLTSTAVDCDDDTVSTNPGSTDICGNGIDEDCSGADEICSSTNRPPTASSLSIEVNLTLQYVEQQLIATDPDGDTITYELISPATGTDYDNAYINQATGMLYVTIQPNAGSTVTLQYRVTDGLIFSAPASITIAITENTSDNQTGGNLPAPSVYAGFEILHINGMLSGVPSTDPSRPSAIDLSPNFPAAGNQGEQNSCVGWAVGYALKSFQEKSEIGWSLNSLDHIFSPAYIYNQINGGVDQGSLPHEALELVVNQGVSTWSMMPYSDQNHSTQPTPLAVQQADNFRAIRWATVNGVDSIKAALANRLPVVAGIQIYSPFYNLFGQDAVYNLASGNALGGHAVTMVGYDDNKYGGAVKVINSWGRNWGNEGYFWLPYSFFPSVVMQAYVLEDAENGTIVDDGSDSEPPSPSELPNLQVQSWQVAYDPTPRGAGLLEYSVINSGNATAPAGANVCMMLSSNTSINISDTYVVCEEIQSALEPGWSVFRNSDNPISFNFPDQIQAGTYYMALWVDDLDFIDESNEDDNLLLGDEVINIATTKPDLTVNTWYAEWDSASGDGTLTYEVINNGKEAASAEIWDINLVLTKDDFFGTGDEIYLFYESSEIDLQPNQFVYRDQNNPARFNLYRDFFGDSVPEGTYNIGLWVDDLDRVDESNELNNGSLNWGLVTIPGALPLSVSRQTSATTDTDNIGKAYNGKKLSSPEIAPLMKIDISRSADGSVTLSSKTDLLQNVATETDRRYSKESKSSDFLVFPIIKSIPMPDNR